MPSSTFLQNKIALVTGASSGIGALTSEFLATQGLQVILVARREEKLREIASQITAAGGKAIFRVCDLTVDADRISLFNNLNLDGLLPDILVNNAGIGWYGYFHDMPWEVVRELLSLNIEATSHLTLLFIPHMRASGYGHIVNIGSVAGKLPEQGVAVYASSKSFLDSFTTSLYRELAGTNVHVSVLRAGPIKTEFFAAARKLENGGNVPAEKLATSAIAVSDAIWWLLRRPRKVVYVPAWMILSPLLEYLFEWAVDLVGPLLLKKKQKQ